MSSEIRIVVDTATLKRLVVDDLSCKLNVTLDVCDVNIEVKASMNYRSEWEKGEFRATIVKHI